MTFLTGTPLECVIHPDLWHVSQLTPGDITTTTSEPIASASAKNLRSLINSLNPSHADAFMPKLNSQSINVVRLEKMALREKISNDCEGFYIFILAEDSTLPQIICQKVLCGELCLALCSLSTVLSIPDSDSFGFGREGILNVRIIQNK